ncbi:hypothetical protein KC207_08810 [Phycicoccus sp. BSK3Z-2]|uniref:Uncharacterized protein n=1 Tax=Phycicoccus avicenniae TaxID=2828860 RepID=A0A941D953_9MICO|nr:hypothetical protein [Phycicoccus avicenniae]MBR7743388.1 hypothetical protein [Phycicoccus avicenniae]
MPRTPAVAVVAASGGLGASTLALAVGRRLAATGPPSLVVDLDLDGGGLDVTAGVEHLPGRRWPGLAGARGRLPVEALVGSLPTEDGCSLLAGGGPGRPPPAARTVEDVLASSVAGRHRLVLDCPRASAHLAAVLDLVPLVLVVLGLRTRALADADALVDRLLGGDDRATPGPDVRLVTRGPRPRAELLDDVVGHLGVSHLGHLGDDPRVVRDAERGLWPGTGRDEVRVLADRVVEVLEAVAADGPAAVADRAS